MASTDIPDNVNFSLLSQTIPGTYNKYNRVTIREDLNLQFPDKIGINNWSDELRWKNFMIYPPRPRGVMIEDTEEMEASRLEKMGVKMDVGLPESIKNLDKFKFAIKKYSHDGVDMKETEELTLPEIMADIEPLRRVARLQNLFSIVQGDQVINLQPSIIQGMANQQVLLGVIREAIAELGTTQKQQKSKQISQLLSFNPQISQQQAQQIITEKTLVNFNDIIGDSDLEFKLQMKLKMTTDQWSKFQEIWGNHPEVELDISLPQKQILLKFDEDLDKIEQKELKQQAETPPPQAKPIRPASLKWDPNAPPFTRKTSAGIGLPHNPYLIDRNYYDSIDYDGRTALIKYIYEYGTNKQLNTQNHRSFGLSQQSLQQTIQSGQSTIVIFAKDNIKRYTAAKYLQAVQSGEVKP